jgi:hypothetical protein
MTFELSVNGHSSRAASVAEFRRALIPFAFHEFREICINIDEGGCAPVALGLTEKLVAPAIRSRSSIVYWYRPCVLGTRARVEPLIFRKGVGLVGGMGVF